MPGIQYPKVFQEHCTVGCLGVALLYQKYSAFIYVFKLMKKKHYFKSDAEWS